MKRSSALKGTRREEPQAVVARDLAAATRLAKRVGGRRITERTVSRTYPRMGRAVVPTMAPLDDWTVSPREVKNARTRKRVAVAASWVVGEAPGGRPQKSSM